MLALLLWSLAQTARCDAVLPLARTHVLRLNPAAAESELLARRRDGCDVELALIYLRGLSAAKAAYARGGDEASLTPVRQAIASAGELAALGETAEIVGFVLRAAAAAAQSERDEMAAMLAQALQVERGRGARGLGGAPLISAHEIAGELWLQVHRYDEAAAAYRIGRAFAGDSPRTMVGLARSLARQNQTADACQEYRRLVAQAPDLRPALKEELSEADEFLRRPACRTAGRR